MVGQGWDRNQLPTTINTPRVLSGRWWQFWFHSFLRFIPRFSGFGLIQAIHISWTFLISHNMIPVIWNSARFGRIWFCTSSQNPNSANSAEFQMYWFLHRFNWRWRRYIRTNGHFWRTNSLFLRKYSVSFAIYEKLSQSEKRYLGDMS